MDIWLSNIVVMRYLSTFRDDTNILMSLFINPCNTKYWSFCARVYPIIYEIRIMTLNLGYWLNCKVGYWRENSMLMYWQISKWKPWFEVNVHFLVNGIMENMVNDMARMNGYDKHMLSKNIVWLFLFKIKDDGM